MPAITDIGITNFWHRTILVTVTVAAIAFAWFSIRWQLGDMLGELTPPSSPDSASAADLAVSMSTLR